ncbi:MAG: transaldolase [Rhodospirillaceae bacterium]|nr:transaldolase [Rhodospirillaceae bacterium]
MKDPLALKVELFVDSADFDNIVHFSKNPLISGFTTNPSLMHKSGASDYEAYARKILAAVPNHQVAVEVIADDLATMEAEARVIATWGPNVNVKIPVTTTHGEFTGPIIRALSADGIFVNVTVVFTLEQVRAIATCLDPNTPAIVSIFAGRVADTGVDPLPLMQETLRLLAHLPKTKVIWASTRGLLHIAQADEIGCHIITVPPDILEKLPMLGKDLATYSLEGVQAFYRDTQASGFQIRL